MTLHERLAELMDASDLTVVEIARRMGKNKDHLHQIRRGDRPNPSGDTILGILRTIGKDWSALKGVDAVAEAPPPKNRAKDLDNEAS